MIGRDEKILNDIIKPKDKLIEELYQDNVTLHKELSKQAKTIEEAEKYQNERDKIIADNEELNNYDIENQYKSKIRKLEKENKYLNKIINKFWETLDKFIHWICKKFDIAEEDNLIRDFQKENEYFYRSRKADKE